MSSTQHRAVIVTTTTVFEDKLLEAHLLATKLHLPVSGIVPAMENLWQSFAILPDGSKVGHTGETVSNRGREIFVSWLKDQIDRDGSPLLDYAMVSFGDHTPDLKTNCKANAVS